jgi:hypothetical protein
MVIAIRPFTEDLIPAVKAFNSRLTAGGAPQELFRFPENPIPDLLPRVDDRKIYEEYFLSVEDDSVRGGYILKHQDFSFHGEIRSIGALGGPVSEGIVNRKYAWVALQMERSALKRQPLLYGLGMGRWDSGPLIGILTTLGWSVFWVPFYFKANHPQRVLREIQVLRKTPAQRLVMHVAAGIGAGLALRMLQWARAKRGAADERAEGVRGFGGWADDLWNECNGRYAMIGVRDSETLSVVYPASNRRFLRYRVTRGREVIGWAVVLDTPMHENKYFGNLRVGSIVDCLALPENAPAVIRAATQVLEERGVDLVVSNQSHACWCAALRDAGFLRGPSNFAFAASRKLGQLLHPLQIKIGHIHMTRGDGDGPIHL